DRGRIKSTTSSYSNQQTNFLIFIIFFRRGAPPRRPRPDSFEQTSDEVLPESVRADMQNAIFAATNRRLEALGRRGMARTGAHERDRVVQPNLPIANPIALSQGGSVTTGSGAGSVQAERRAQHEQIQGNNPPVVRPIPTTIEGIDHRISTLAHEPVTRDNRLEFRDLIRHRFSLITGISLDEVEFVNGVVRSSIVVYPRLNEQQIILMNHNPPSFIRGFAAQRIGNVYNLFAEIDSVERAVFMANSCDYPCQFVQRVFVRDVARFLGGRAEIIENEAIAVRFCDVDLLLRSAHLLHRSVVGGQQIVVSPM
ncbi:hypothetical protein PRIPAC_89895, partial [Pristionchus pacificus]|uniref:Uncharacterized protein n=1 Tax=Pristionchus pacificus TaxID=54126 RepID=A0A2A6CZ57_PRIPA